MVVNIHSLEDEQIFQYYFKEPIMLGKLYKSPYRRDRNPTGSFFVTESKTLLFHDFGTGKKWTARKTVEFMENIPFYKVDDALRKNYDKISKMVVEKLVDTRDLTIRASVDEDESSLSYFYDFGITKQTLTKFGVKPIKTVYYNNELRFRSTKTNPIFGYFFKSGNAKIYRPKSPLRENKWAGNATIEDVFGFYNLKSVGRICFIASSGKDAMTLESMGFPAIAFNSENISVEHPFVKSIIRGLKLRFEYVVVLLDNDEAGETSSSKIEGAFKIKRISIPKKYNAKDISDLYKSEKKKTFKLIKKWLRKII